jgi:hypothetical protein
VKIIAKSVVAAAIGLVASSALAESFPASVEDAPALSVAGTTHADRYGAEVASARERTAETRWLPAWARTSDRVQMFNPQIADG